MYTPASSEQDFERRRQRAAEEARAIYGRSVSVPAAPPHPPEATVPRSNAVSAQGPGLSTASDADLLASAGASERSGRGLGGLLSRLQTDDILLVAVFLLLFNESKEDDPLILLILAVLFFT